ncbi:hypothetical protein EUX98_g6110 [Antrodiella citrinella]|uniref:TNase-like domain-containing protein n=1 Tax=Antrodiella citrinella TaxID=2447956 RepID=A0A4S4MS09_9APHY|nr:hypothetical protein EUX98_g6110 [Antrodiella citrinella]
MAKLDNALSSLPPSLLALSALAIGSSTTLVVAILYRRFARRIPNGDWVTPDVLAGKRWIKGYVTNVGDNDNFRVYHTPAFGWRWPLKFRRIPTRRDKLQHQTIHIRIAGVDAPEGAHFGRPGQPYAPEALTWLKSQVEGKTVYCQLFRKDQYGRIVGSAYVPRALVPAWMSKGKNVSVEMLRAGWAVTYEQAGAEYGGLGKEAFLAIQAEAQKAKRGMWKNGVGAETPAEYKKRGASSDKAGEAESQADGQEAQRRPLWRRLFSRT